MFSHLFVGLFVRLLNQIVNIPIKKLWMNVVKFLGGYASITFWGNLHTGLDTGILFLLFNVQYIHTKRTIHLLKTTC